ncbi:hypothetical protein AJ80_04277 [Polytolypa hystricis UAMH7299]|uniref:Uncharacterized protein n=1 Tax=Polytolypa hystricis (strain UAMH7299) TaxID=1447883 RepID=A0A2B7YCM9_POLH7|nr:hypothetical protein AJ80_04277 [Polytolypa hystricis UAMH7299]
MAQSTLHSDARTMSTSTVQPPSISRAILHLEKTPQRSNSWSDRDVPEGKQLTPEQLTLNRLEYIKSQLPALPQTSEQLTIDYDTPTDEEWQIITNHFTSIPLHWPLERLDFNSPCGLLVQTPWVIEGRVKHLRLTYTCGLRFGGPTNNKLVKSYDEKIEKAEVEECKVNGIKIMSLPELAHEWLVKNFTEPPPPPSQEGRYITEVDVKEEEIKKEAKDNAANLQPPAQAQQPNLETFGIIENDVHDTLVRLLLARPEIFNNLKTLYLRATNGCDLHIQDGSILPQILPLLTELKSLTLVLGNEYGNPKYLTEIYQRLPANVETLHFRSMASLARTEEWKEWVRAFGGGEFLPNLRRLSVVLDLKGEVGKEVVEEKEEETERQDPAHDDEETKSSLAETALSPEEPSQDSTLLPSGTDIADPTQHASESNAEPPAVISGDGDGKRKYAVTRDDLCLAKRACEELCKAAEKRGVVIVPFVEPYGHDWPKNCAIDDRWETV